MTLVQKEVKAVYIGSTKVWPKPTRGSYEYTFTNSSWSVIDDTWSITNQSSTTYNSSYWLFRNYWTSETILTKSIDLSALTSQLKITWYGRSRSSGGSNSWAIIWLAPNTSSAYDSWIWIHFNWYDFWIWIGNGSSANMNWKSISNTYNTDENIEATFNFSWWTASGTVRGQTVSISVDSSDLNTAKTYTWLKVCTGTEWIKWIKIEWS